MMVGTYYLVFVGLAHINCCSLSRLEKCPLQGRLNIQSNAAALRAFMRQRWYIQANVDVCSNDSNKVTTYIILT